MYWEFWMGGLALAGVALGHWLLVGRMMAVSGRFTVMINQLRFGKQEQVEFTTDELMAAMQAATLEEFGKPEPQSNPAESIEGATTPHKPPPQTLLAHVLFLGSLIAGGLLASITSTGWHATSSIRSELFTDYFGRDPMVGAMVLLAGGLLVGFGTRMAAGCTSGHGLCGVSRFQIGSLVATAAFFGTGIAVSVLLRAVA